MAPITLDFRALWVRWLNMSAFSLSYQPSGARSAISWALIISVRAYTFPFHTNSTTVHQQDRSALIHHIPMQRLIRFETVSFRLLHSVPPRPQRLTPICARILFRQHLSSIYAPIYHTAQERPQTRVRFDQFCGLSFSFFRSLYESNQSFCLKTINAFRFNKNH